jgi:GH25 family lysozyme M1 (1,4-beta-N-acetylmuramidase)
MALHDVVIDVQMRRAGSTSRRSPGPGSKSKATEGDMFTASTWHANLRNATAVGIKVVPYHFVAPGRIVDQVAHFQSLVGLARGMAYTGLGGP